MPRNMEIKARVASLNALEPRVAAIATEGPFEIEQDDTFFHSPHGRLKLRAFSPSEAELIFYRRADREGPKESFYLRTPVAQPEPMRELLTQAYGQAGRVRKHRTLYLVGRTRVHLDRVEELGEFLELEVVLRDDEPAASGEQEAHALLTRLGIDRSQLLSGAYVDLMRCAK
jgi:predicted adenylyl cyclase CyaB